MVEPPLAVVEFGVRVVSGDVVVHVYNDAVLSKSEGTALYTDYEIHWDPVRVGSDLMREDG